LVTSFVTDSIFTHAKELNATTVSLFMPALTRESASRLTDAGLEIVVWTVNDVPTATRARELGAVGLCTDTPETIIKGLAS
jgi:glycerophosphoryl diester phosphodiesterase